MANQKTNTTILTIIAVVVVAILGILVYKNFIEKTPEEKMADSISKTIDNVGDAVSKDIGGKN